MKPGKKRCLRMISFVLIYIMMLTIVSPLLSSAAVPNTPKEEVVYVNLNADGTVREINVVNIFDLDEAGQIIDYGRYESLRNMTTTDEIHQDQGQITIDADAGKLYYEGRLDSNVMPWNLSIRYYMDGKEYSAEEIAGQSGALKITVSITQNTECEGNFFDGYALQAALTLDTKQCSNIVAADATIANVGSDKQLTYTILPGKGAEFEITADVQNFEMEGIAVNGIPLNLNIEVDDEELMDRISELTDAVEQLDDGAAQLQDGISDLQTGVRTDLQDGINDLQSGAEELYTGAGELQDGGSSLQSGAAQLQDGAASLNTGLQSLNQGILQVQTALDTLNEKSASLSGGSASFRTALGQLQSALKNISVTTDDLAELRSASSQILTSIGALETATGTLQDSISFDAYKAIMAGYNLNVDELVSGNSAAIANLQDMIALLEQQKAAGQSAGEDTSALEEQIEQLKNVVKLLGANNSNIGGMENYLGTMNGKAGELHGGLVTLSNNYAAFDGKIGELVESLGQMAYQMGELSSAVNTLVTEYAKIDSGIGDYTGAVAQIVTGYRQISGSMVQILEGSSALKSGTDELYSGTGDLLSGIGELYDGTGTLYDGTGTLHEGVTELESGINELYDGAGELRDGTSTMRDETSGMDEEINNEIDEMIDNITGGQIKLTSFVSSQNTNVECVQFVIKADGVHVEEIEEEPEEEPEQLNFWQKLVRLFTGD
ncbi:MAG: hypothetical protein ACI4DW_12145 [Lachnospiraceae bacterium]